MKKQLTKNKYFFQRVKRLFYISALSFITFLILSLLILSFNKDKISSRLQLSANSLIQGKIIFDNISLSPFVQFPYTSISLNSLKLYDNVNDSGIQPIVDIEYLHAAINLRELVKGNVIISSILIENGKVNVVIYPDSSINILKAIKRNDLIKTNITTDSLVYENSQNADTIESHNLILSLDGIGFKNIDINIIDKKNKQNSSLTINTFTSNLNFFSDSLSVELKTTAHVNSFQASKSLVFSNKIIELDGKLNLNTLKNIVYINYAKIGINDASFILSGIAHLDKEKEVDISYQGSNTNMEFFSFFLNKVGLNNLKKGEIYINGDIIGSFANNEIPIVICRFGIKNMELDIPETEPIKNLNLSGYFNSGSKKDLSKAIIRIDTLTAILPNGSANGKLLMSNFKKPQLQYIIDLKTDLNGLQKVFNTTKIDQLTGSVEIYSEFDGKFSENLQLLNKTMSYTSVKFDTVSFVIPGKAKYIEIDGQLLGNVDTLCINNLSALIGNSDFYITGMAYNISTLIIPNDNDFISHLNISSNLFDLTDFMNYRENIGIGFPYQTANINLDVLVQTNKKRLLESLPVPDITFDINKLNATVNKLLPPVSLSNGTFILGNNNGDLLLTLNNFDVATVGGELKADVKYHEPFTEERYVEIDAQITDFNPIRFFTHKADNNSNLNASLNGDAYCKLSFTNDTNVLFSHINFNANKLTYQTDSASYNAKGLNINTNFVNYNNDVIKNPLATLSTNMVIKATKVALNDIIIDSIEYLIDAKNGGYNISSENIELLGKDGRGNLYISPFLQPIIFKIDFEVNNLDVNNLLQIFVKDTLVKGNIDFNFNLSAQADSINKLLKSLNGDISLNGNNLLFYGVELDELLTKVERSRHFNLVDLGAVLVAGPAGLLLSKGTTYTNILLTDRKSSTNILRFNSDWEIKNGAFNMSDVAFSTKKNRIAANGWLNMSTDSLDISIAVVDSKGCSKLSQRLRGSIKKPDKGELVIISSLIAPVTNLFDVRLSKCKPFYTGSVKHPKIDKK